MNKVNNQILDQQLKIKSVTIIKQRESKKKSKLLELYSLAIEKKLLSRPTIDPYSRQITNSKSKCRVKPVPAKKQAVQSKPLQERVENIPLPLEKTLVDEINKKKLSIVPENTTSAQQQEEEVKHRYNPTPSLSNKRAPEPLEEEPEQKRIKLTIIIERSSEGATYKIKK